MDLSQNTTENIEFMVTAIKEKLRMVNAGAVKPEDFNEEMYEDLHDLYVMVNRKDQFSPSEMNAIIEEMGNLRRISVNQFTLKKGTFPQRYKIPWGMSPFIYLSYLERSASDSRLNAGISSGVLLVTS